MWAEVSFIALATRAFRVPLLLSTGRRLCDPSPSHGVDGSRTFGSIDIRREGI